MMGIGAAEITIVLMFLGGFGLPLGVPPQAENPAMQYVAPEQCLLYSTWAGMAKPDGTSANQTEQLFAEPEVHAFAASLDKTIGQMVAHFARQSGDPKAETLAKVVPLWTRTVITKASAVYATKAEIANGRLAFEGGLLVEGGDQAANLAEGLVQLMSSPDNPPQPVTVGTLKFVRFASQADGPIDADVTIGAAGPYVLVGFGKGAVEGMMDRVRAKKVPAWLTEIGTRLPVERRASLSYINTKKLMETFLPLAGPDGAKIVQALGLDQLGELVSVTGLDKEGMVNRSLIKIEGNPTGLLALVDTQGIKPEQVDFLPKDATFATAFSLNAQQIYSFVGHLVAQSGPDGVEEFEQMSKDFRQMFGMRLQEDLLASLGETWTLSMAPADGWLGITATVEVRDVAKIGDFQKRIEGMFSDAPPGSGAPQVERTQFNGHTINTLAIPQMPIRPAWCVSGSRLIIALSPQTIKAQLSSKPAEIGLFAGPPFAPAFQGEGRVISLSYQDTQKVFETAYSYLTILAPMMMDMDFDGGFREGPPAPKFFDFNSLPSSRSIHRHLKPSVSITRRVKDGLETESRQTFPTVNIGTAAPVAVALLLPAVQAARSAARRMQSANNIKQQVLGMQNYHDTFLTMPAAYSVDKAKKPLLSWRVHILPFIEQRPLYDQFKFDEPWDSEHNKKLIARMPQAYRSPGSSAAPGMTTYLAIGGERGMFTKPEGTGDGARTGGLTFAACTDGTANTIAVVEAGDEKAVIWTKPDEFVPDEKAPLKGLKGPFPGGFLAGFLDGHVQFIKLETDPVMVWRAFQRDDGQVLNLGE
jgi:hypothetical protein